MNEKAKLTEEKIFDAAAAVFEKKGLDGARMQEIADQAGINKALLHYYFRSKEKLFDAVFGKLAGYMFDKLFSCFDNDLPLQEKLTLFYQQHMSFLQAHPRLPAFILNEINKHPEHIVSIFNMERIRSFRHKMFQQMDVEMNAGRLQKIDKMQLLINIIGLSVFPFAARGLIEILLAEDPFDFNELIEQRKKELPQFVINAVKAQ